MAIAAGASQKAQSSSTASLTTAAITTQVSGSSFLVFPVYVTGNLAASTPITDSKGNTYTAIGTEVTNGGLGVSMRPYLCTNGTGGASHTFSMANTSTSVAAMAVLEITGGLTASLLDQYVASVVSSGPPFNQPVTTSAQADELVVAFGVSNSSSATVNYTVGGSFSKQQEQTDGATVVSLCLATRVVSATGAYDPAWNPSAGTTVTAITLSLKAAAGGSTSITPTTGALSFTGQTPTVTNSGGATNTSRTPTAGALTFTGQQPVLTLTVASPGVGSMTFTGQAPSLLTNNIRVPGVGSLSFTGAAPSVANSGGSRSIAPGTGSLSLAGFFPTVANSGVVNSYSGIGWTRRRRRH
jgi:hypothetical protein